MEKIILLQLTTEHWFKHVTKLLQTMEDSGFGEFFVKCHLGVWLSRFRSEKIFDDEWLDSIQLAHDEFYELAKTLINKHQNGEVTQAREGIKELETAYINVSNYLETYA